MIDIDRSMALYFNVIVCNVFVKSGIVTRKVNLRQDDVEGICIFHKKFSLFGYLRLMFIGDVSAFSQYQEKEELVMYIVHIHFSEFPFISRNITKTTYPFTYST